ncbi:MAG: Clp protease N-terminal domain-containing protein [Candidatus Sericytochromatia bacterium]|nr:Clp protease N-terminal domain-containing protein [Candidatus Sericytochromatia bacterium]
MLEKFSAGAIQALNAAREEALRLEFNHVDVDHLLLGLAHEQRGLCLRVLQRHGVAARRLRLAVEQCSGRGYSLARQEDLVFAPGTIRVLARAAAARPRLVESQDLFLALLDEPDTAGLAVLTELGLSPAGLRGEAARLAGVVREEAEAGAPAEGVVLPRHFTPRLLTPAGQSVLSYAHAAARFFGHTLVGTEQLLAGLVYVRSGLAAKVLEAHGVDPLRVEAVAARAIGRGSGTVAGRLTRSRWCEEVCESAWSVARKQGLGQVGTGHLLIGLLELDVGGALYILDQLDLNLGQLRDDVEGALAAVPHDPEPDEAVLGGLAPPDDERVPEGDDA